jgi:hypothetical protein
MPPKKHYEKQKSISEKIYNFCCKCSCSNCLQLKAPVQNKVADNIVVTFD